VVAFALPKGGAGLLAQSMAPTLRTVGALLLIMLTALLIWKLARRNWFWYPLLAILVVIATWVAWIASQSIAVSLLTLFVAVVIAWLVTLGRNRRWRAAST
jgi:hypothetical protein